MAKSNKQGTTNEVKSISSLDQITNIVKRKDATYASHFKIPSLDKDVAFNEINTSQQKRLVKAVIDSPVYNTEFIYTFRDILKENCQDESVNIDDLTIIDKLVLALAMRSKSIGNTVDIEVETKGKPPTKVSVTLELEKILEAALKTVQNIPNRTFEDSYFKVECSLPTIGTEYRLEKELRVKTDNVEIENLAELRQTIGDAFISEIVKYVNSVSVKGDDDNLIAVDWKSFTYTDRIKVIETFKTGLLKDIISFINDVRKEIDKVELVRFEFEGEKYDRRLSIDGDFFTIS